MEFLFVVELDEKVLEEFVGWGFFVLGVLLIVVGFVIFDHTKMQKDHNRVNIMHFPELRQI